MFSVGGTVLKEKYANAEDQTDLPSGADEGEGVRQGSEHEARNREIFEDDGRLDSAAAQSADAMMEVAGILAGGNFDDLSEEDLAKIKNPALRAQLQGKSLKPNKQRKSGPKTLLCVNRHGIEGMSFAILPEQS